MTFIPIAERNGLIGPIGAWVLHEACVQACSWPGTENARRALLALKQLGIRLAIDDFGVGQSSLGQLRTILPIDTLKIDRSFVDGLGRSSEGTAIFDAVVQLARSLGVRALAEGVETPAQAHALRSMACTVAQGYHFARPLGPDEVARLLAAPVDLAA
jgi:EAL domain-containing protein (putative c-di-GMP-specific phosphodiesterase class I)